MVTLIKRHVIGIFALVLMVATMSFKFAEKDLEDSVTIYWYQKDPGTGVYSPTSSPDPSCVSSNAQICALGFDTPQSNVHDGMEDDATDKRYRP